MKNIDFKKILPHVIAVAIMVIISLIYFSPVLEGYKLYQGDIVQFKGVSNEIYQHRAEFHEEPLWTNGMFGGMPAYQVSAKLKNPLLMSVDRFFQLWLPHPVSLIFLYMVGFYFLMLRICFCQRLFQT